MNKITFCAVNNPNCGKKKKTVNAKSVKPSIVSSTIKSPKTTKVNNFPKRKVKARKTSGGTQLSLIRYLLLYKTDGISYVAINNYFKNELDNSVGIDSTSKLFIKDMITYDKRAGDDEKDYDEVIDAITNASTMINWEPLFDIVQGLKYY